MAENLALGIGLAVLSFIAVGAGVGAAGTSLLALLATRVAPNRRAPAATIVWLMMIFGFIVTTALAGRFLDPYSPARLLAVTGTVCGIAVAAGAGRDLAHGARGAGHRGSAPPRRAPFREALAQVWAEPEARRFTIFVFVSMLAYSAQDLILEPFGGQVFGSRSARRRSSPGPAHGRLRRHDPGGAGRRLRRRALRLAARLDHRRLPRLGLALAALASAGMVGPGFPLARRSFALGIANGAFAVAAIATMMHSPAAAATTREGMRDRPLGRGAGGGLRAWRLCRHGGERSCPQRSSPRPTWPMARCSRPRRCCSSSRPVSRPAIGQPGRGGGRFLDARAYPAGIRGRRHGDPKP